MVDNLVPFIPKEEEKVAKEAGKILGRLGEGSIVPHPMLVGATCTRANILDGRYSSVGIGSAIGADGMKYFAVIFAGQ